MGKIIVHNRAKITDSDALKYASDAVGRSKDMLKAVGSVVHIEYHNWINVQIIKNKTCYTVVIS